MTILLRIVEQYFTVCFQSYPIWKFVKFITFGLGTARSKRFKEVVEKVLKSYDFSEALQRRTNPVKGYEIFLPKGENCLEIDMEQCLDLCTVIVVMIPQL